MSKDFNNHNFSFKHLSKLFDEIKKISTAVKIFNTLNYFNYTFNESKRSRPVSTIVRVGFGQNSLTPVVCGVPE